MARSVHQAVGEFGIRGPIAGLAVLSGVLAVRNSFENPSPANARTVFAALSTVWRSESPYNGIHQSDYHRVRALQRVLEPVSAVEGREAGDSAANVAASVRNALQSNGAIVAFFDVSGTGADVVLTAKTRAANDATMNIAYTNGSATGLTEDPTSADTTAGVAPVAQVETATVASGASANANVIVTVTAAGMTGSPKAINVAVLSSDNTAALVAAKIRTALGADAAVTALFTVGGSSATVTLTRTSPAGVSSDGTLNIAIDGTTNSTGVTDALTSANTTAGVAGTKQVETATIVGTPTTDGNILVTITAAGLTGSPLSIQVPVNGSQGTDVLITDAIYAAAKASSDPAEQALRAALVTVAQNYIPGFTGVGINNAALF